jgi:uncharacterized membrane protein
MPEVRPSEDEARHRFGFRQNIEEILAAVGESFAAVTEATVSQAEPLTLIAELQRSERRWKMLALGLLSVLVVVLLIVALLTLFVWIRVKAEQRRAMEAMERAEQMRQEAIRAEQMASGAAGNEDQEHPMEVRPKGLGKLPDISVFQAHPSDRFLVDRDDFTNGHPFKGKHLTRVLREFERGKP